MKKMYLVVFFLIMQICFSQAVSRKLIQGKIISDSTKIEDVTIFNVNSKIAKSVTNDGFFELLVKANDTLLFSGLLFKSKRVILTDKIINQKLLIIELEPSVIELDEVVINNIKLNPISGGSQKYVDKQFFGDSKSSLKNQFVYDGSITNGINFVRLFKDAAKIFKKKETKKATFVSEVEFSEYTLKRIKPSFFTSTLDLKEEQVKLFLVFCENDVKTKSLIESKSDFELMDFLIAKSKEFKEILFEK